jgi:hypothetical protein
MLVHRYGQEIILGYGHEVILGYGHEVILGYIDSKGLEDRQVILG